MKRKIRHWLRTQAHSPRIVIGFSLLSGLALIGWWLRFLSPADVPALLLTLGTVGMPTLGLAWSGYRLEQSDIASDRYVRPVAWCLGGAVGLLAVALPTMLIFPWHDPVVAIAWTHFAVTAGAIGGFAVGYVEARAVQREVDATAAAVRADQLAEERQVLAYLNDLLRHEVLNSAQIIGGHASLLLEEPPTPSRKRRLETIDSETESLQAVIDDVRVMLDANARTNQPAVVDLSTLLVETVTMVQTEYTVDIDTTIPASITVDGNDGLKRIFMNVLENAIEHNDNECPHVELTVETTSETVTVTIADDGPGIPQDERATLFDRKSSNHGLGLYLVRILVTRYGGAVDLVETGPEGSVFAITLPRASSQRRQDTNEREIGPTGQHSSENAREQRDCSRNRHHGPTRESPSSVVSTASLQ
ncbi:GHKL domain-containing protein [Natronolimnobius sp. AArcel1]|uniref:sensor histidine kinase n=1 Tax=Natronolimnobius sp. AArcel1 TaxID=1679093 RepID=UPI0013ED4B0C|nr:HAMP domain-containing sensor histidine kinase [Natronolimnobius sp. AArcel1]NGM68396.1 GHKL domain-containing protein [Natronolimnobius sp. AArcel1]